LEECRLPLTGAKCVDLIITNLAVFKVDPKNGLTLVEVAPGETVDSVREATEAPFEVAV
ncbi:succinyl-CoA--3-ketoacid-CoA transferase, partial [Corynebacterium gottingense]